MNINFPAPAGTEIEEHGCERAINVD